MKIISSIFLILIPIFCFTQSSQSIDIVSGIDYYRTTGANSDDIKILEGALSIFLHSENIETLEELNAIKRGKVNWMVGVNYNKRIDDKLFFKLGIRIANLGFDKIVQTGITILSVDPVTLEITPTSSSVNSINFTNNYWFLDIPAAIRFESSEKKFSSFFEIGASSLIYLTHRKSQESILDTSFFPDDQFHFDYFNRIRWVGFVSFGFNYNLCEKLQIFAQPIFRYNITPLASSRIIHDHLLTAGLELGLRKKF